MGIAVSMGIGVSPEATAPAMVPEPQLPTEPNPLPPFPSLGNPPGDPTSPTAALNSLMADSSPNGGMAEAAAAPRFGEARNPPDRSNPPSPETGLYTDPYRSSKPTSPDAAGRTRSENASNAGSAPASQGPWAPPVREAVQQDAPPSEEMVMFFIQNALSGCPCTYIADSGKRCDARYFFDEQLLTFVVSVQIYKGCAAAEFKCPLNSITGCFSLKEQGVEHFPMPVTDGLSAAEHDLLLRVTYINEKGEMSNFNLLEISGGAVRILLESLRILRMHAAAAKTLPGVPE